MDVHALVDQVLAVDEAQYHQFYHPLHREMDLYVESYRVALAVNALKDFPLMVVGRGWEFVARSRAAGHSFHRPRSMAESQALFYSDYGLIDLTPSNEITDRARRALANRQPLLSSAHLRDRVAGAEAYDRLFFDLRPGNMQAHCDRILTHPQQHQALCRAFADFYAATFSEADFVARLTHCAQRLSAFKSTGQ